MKQWGASEQNECKLSDDVMKLVAHLPKGSLASLARSPDANAFKDVDPRCRSARWVLVDCFAEPHNGQKLIAGREEDPQCNDPAEKANFFLRRAKRGAFLTKHESSERAKMR